MADAILRVQIGLLTRAGRQTENRDFVAALSPSGREHMTKGAVVAVADGVSAGCGGREAAEISVRGLIEGYYGLPETLGIERAAARAVEAVNRWVHTLGGRDPQLRDMATTLSALILCRRQAHVVHVGDTRIYQLRQSRLQLLTTDHTRSHPDLRHVLIRAIGLEENLRVDHSVHTLQPHDRYLICSDGVHSVLNHRRLQELLSAKTSPQESAERLISAALDAGSHDNVSAAVVDIIDVPAADQVEIDNLVAALPIRDVPRAGDTVDDFFLEKVIAEGRYSRLFLAQDRREQRQVIAKFPQPRVAEDSMYRNAFAREAWIGARVHSPFLSEVIELSPSRQTCLYSVCPYYAGETLEEYLRAHPRVNTTRGIEIGTKLAKAVYALNRQGIVHRDIKPDNVLLQSPAGLRLLDFGVAKVPALGDAAEASVPGTPSFMAPELFRGETGDTQSDVYALGVTLYRVFTGHYPYGEIEPFSRPRFARSVPLHRYRPDLPAWLDAVLAKAVHVDKTKRYSDAMEFAFALEHGLAEGGHGTIVKSSLYERHPLRFWQATSALLLIALLVALAHLPR